MSCYQLQPGRTVWWKIWKDPTSSRQFLLVMIPFTIVFRDRFNDIGGVQAAARLEYIRLMPTG